MEERETTILEEIKPENRKRTFPYLKGLRELAAHLGMHYTTLSVWNKQGYLKVKYRVNRTMFFDPDDFLYHDPRKRRGK